MTTYVRKKKKKSREMKIKKRTEERKGGVPDQGSKRSDNGKKFTCMKRYFLDHGIIFQTSYTRTPQQNGRVERKHRHVLNVVRALRFQDNLPIKFWGGCILTVAYLIN